MSQDQSFPIVLTEKEVAEKLRVSMGTISRLRKSGKIRHKRVGNMIRYQQNWLLDYLGEAKCPEKKSAGNTVITGCHSVPDHKTITSRGTKNQRPKGDGQTDVASALQTLKTLK